MDIAAKPPSPLSQYLTPGCGAVPICKLAAVTAATQRNSARKRRRGAGILSLSHESTQAATV